MLIRLRKFALYTSRKKCEFFTIEVEFLGYIMSTIGVLIDSHRVATVKD